MKRQVLTTLLVGALAQRAVAQPAADALSGEHEVLAGDPVPPSAPAGADLANAADATAGDATAPPAAPVPATARAPEPPTHASSDAIDLSSLGLEPSAVTFDDKLNIYGFGDVGFRSDSWSRHVLNLQDHAKTFLVGNLNIYVAKNLTAKARSLIEVRFTFLPNGSQNLDGSVVDTTALDPTNFNRPSQWGGVVIERAYIEYDLTEHLTLRGGHWLTPYGIWNIDHGSPTILGTSRPYTIGGQFFPEHQTGLDLLGSYDQDGYKLGFHATASNGRGATEAQADQDNKLAFGGRLELETPWGLKVGGSYYRGRFTGVATTAGAPPETYLEAAVGGDAQLDRGALHLQAEVVASDRHYAGGQRTAMAGGFTPDGRELGFYALAGYRFDRLWNVMPFTFCEEGQPSDHLSYTTLFDANLGLNFRPAPSLVFKVVATYFTFANGVGYLAGTRLYELSAQAAWVF